MLLLWQLISVVLPAAILSVLKPELAPAFLMGGIAVWLPNMAVAAAIQASSGLGVVFYAMLRGVLIAFAAVGSYLVFAPIATGYFLGIATGVVAITVLPPIYNVFIFRLTARTLSD